MDAARALADLTEMSSQIEAAVLARADGTVVASTLSGDAEAGRIAEAGRELLQEAERTAAGERASVTQLVAETREGAVFVVRESDLVVAAVTVPEPTVGLVFYDLRTSLRLAAEQAPEPAAAGEGSPRDT